jgi:hypothetical protein
MSRRNGNSKGGRAALLGAVLLLTAVTVAAAHDMFLKPTRYSAPENSEVRVRVLNGTFTRSENSIARNRLADASVLTPVRRIAIDTAEWAVTGDTSTFHIHTRGAGTYVIGASTRPSVIDLSADDFNSTSNDGIPDALRRAEGGELQAGRAIPNIKAGPGGHRPERYATVGYPAEIIPMETYSLSSGASCGENLVDGKPVANQLVLFGGTTADEAAIEPKSARSNAEGVATIPLSAAGIWYIKFINMARVRGDSVDYESKWASLTFQVR